MSRATSIRVASAALLCSAALSAHSTTALRPGLAASAPLVAAPDSSGTVMSSVSGGGTTVHSLFGQRIDGARQLAAIGPDDLGDRVNLHNGRLSFRHVDVSVPGNNALPVAVARTREAARNPNVEPGVLGDWDLELPYVGGTYSANRGWNTWSMNGARCSQFGAPPFESYIRGYWYDFEFWSGVHLHAGASGGQEVLLRSSSNNRQPPRPPASPAHLPAWPLVTRDYWQIRCLPSIRNGSGEGFIARSPDGTEYRFDWMATRRVETLRFSNGEMLARNEHRLFATRVTDRFGNFVDYHFEPADPWRLNRITSSDGRVLELRYFWTAGGRRLSEVVQGAHTWRYAYDSFGDLARVTLPDGLAWQFALRNLSSLYPEQVGEGATCDWPGAAPGGPFEGTITHPSGLVGRFQTHYRAHGRHHVPRFCIDKSPPSIPSEWTEEAVVYDGFPKWPRAPMSLTLHAKTLEAPALHSDPGGDGRTDRSVWQFAYPNDGGSWSDCTGCPDRKVVAVTDPRGAVTRYTYGTRFEVNEGQLLRKEEGWDSATGTALRVTDNVYSPTAPGSQPVEPIGFSPNEAADLLQTRHRPLQRTTVVQQGTAFVTEIESFEAFQARPSIVRRSGSGGGPQREQIVYQDFEPLWVLGQVRSRTDLGTLLVPESFEYHGTTALKAQSRRFGLLQERYEYWPDGSLRQLIDPVGRPRTFNDWHRGVPRQVIYRDGATESAWVDDRGLVLWHVDRVGARTDYRYDAMGRLSEIHYPPETWGGYHPTYLTLTRLTAPTEGVPAGYWLHEERTGNARVQRFLDPMWRPRMQRSLDIADPGGTASVVETRYDRAGLKLFDSYPVRALGGLDSAAARGTRYWHDALGREVARLSHTEVGDAVTATAYPASAGELHKLVTNPRGYATRWRFRALGAPSYEDAVVIEQPEGVRVDISRDGLGKPTAVTRSGHYGGSPQSLTRRYVYDGHQRLCKTIEPESGATVQAYDAAGNVAWRASGQALPDASQCNNDGAVPPAARVVNGYDAEDRLTSTAYGDGSPGVVRTYTADGLPRTVASSELTWTYDYWNRRTLKSEWLSWPWQTPGQGWNFAWSRDAHGHVSQFSDPWGGVDFLPNALGQPTRAGGYVTQVRYHPNGMLASYVLGNGIGHTVHQNVRGLTALWEDSGVGRDQYSYDLNANVTAIADLQGGHHRSMPGYDGLDRMTHANGPWGSGVYSYDALDNLRHSHVGSRAALADWDGTRNLPRHYNVNGQRVDTVHDARGNVVQRGGLQMGFDIGNRLRTVTGLASYQYDGHGRRHYMVRTDGSSRLSAYGLDGKLRFSWDSTKGSTRYVHLGGRLVAEHGETSVTYVHTDALGSPVARTNASRTVLERTRYEPYGSTVAGSTNPTGVGFTGHVNDADTGLVYMQQRYYDPVLGRFLSVDPVVADAQTGALFGRYHYAFNNPFKFRDPDGRLPVLDSTTILDVGYGLYDTGQLLGAVAAWGVGLATGNSALASEGAAGARASLFNLGGSLVAAALPAVSAPMLRGGAEVASTTVGGLRAAGKKDAHHVIQDAAARELPGYNTNAAPGIQLAGPANVAGTPHNIATGVQRQAGGGTYAAERRIGYKAMRRAGVSEGDARAAIGRADDYFGSIGVGPATITRIPGNR